MQEVGVILKINNSRSLGKPPYVYNLLLLTTKFYFQNQPPKCRVDGYKFRSVYSAKQRTEKVEKTFLAYPTGISVNPNGAMKCRLT